MDANALCYTDGLPIEEGDAVLYGMEFIPSKVVEIMYSAGRPDAVVLENGVTGNYFLCHSSRVGQLNHVEKKSADFVTAGFDFLHKKAIAGSMRAQYALGNLYLNGKGVKSNLSMALKLLEQAAENNCAPAFYDLGLLYKNGAAVPADSEKALLYFIRAAQEGFGPAHEEVELLRQSKNQDDTNH